MIIARNGTWALVRSGRSSIAQSKPAVERGGNESGQDREASATDSESVSDDGESVSEEAKSEIKTPEAAAAASITSGRAPTRTSRARSSESRVSLDPEGLIPPGEGLVNALAAGSTSHGPDKRYNASSTGEVKQLAEYIPVPPVLASETPRVVKNGG